jgi:hypothetical protein
MIGDYDSLTAEQYAAELEAMGVDEDDIAAAVAQLEADR